MLNPALDKDELAARFREDGRVRIANVFDADIAERMRNCCVNDVPYEFLFHVDGKNVAVSAEEMARLDLAERKAVQQKMLAAAAEGIGFFYCGYKMTRVKADTSNENLKFLHSVFEFLNSDEMLGFASDVSGRNDIRSADAQYTRYTSGHFLTRHRDDVGSEMRRLAYVFSMSRNWHPDWGGLLQFFEDDGTPRDAWTPTFNTMALFDVRHVHSVTFVTPFAKEPRYSLTGWFRGGD
jgi:Rps23 Pro-64 3,4-dihydroxylase Tpa1-like proline 4-hydroxylase